jgi:hypothetical protein
MTLLITESGLEARYHEYNMVLDPFILFKLSFLSTYQMSTKVVCYCGRKNQSERRLQYYIERLSFIVDEVFTFLWY